MTASKNFDDWGNLKLKVMSVSDNLVPRHAHPGDAGLDLRAANDGYISVGKSRMVGTGIAVEIPKGYVGLMFPRSGLGSRGITLRNAVGVIDSGYRGEIKMPLWNVSDAAFTYKAGDRLAQLVVVPFAACEVMQVESLTDTERGTDGYGSTGVE